MSQPSISMQISFESYPKGTLASSVGEKEVVKALQFLTKSIEENYVFPFSCEGSQTIAPNTDSKRTITWKVVLE